MVLQQFTVIFNELKNKQITVNNVRHGQFNL